MYWKSYAYAAVQLVENISPFCVFEALDLKWVLYTDKKSNYVIHEMCRRCHFLLSSEQDRACFEFLFRHLRHSLIEL